MAVAITEADGAVASSVLYRSWCASQKAGGQGHFGHIWSLRLI